MCGIVGILGREGVADGVVGALKRLEYRGYDSAGIATLEHDGSMVRVCAPGKLKDGLIPRLETQPLFGHIGIGHTRWATHGKPTEANAHPHSTEKLSLVHNGIIENFKELREELEGRGCVFKSETDSEAIAHLITEEMGEHVHPLQALAASLPRLRGQFAIVVLFHGHDDLLLVARSGSPLAVGYGEGEMFVGSDAIALAPFTNKIAYLEEGDYGMLTRTSCQLFDREGNPVERPIITASGNPYVYEKDNYRHFMDKEIHAQPLVVEQTLGQYCDFASGRVTLPPGIDYASLQRVAISACGTALYAGHASKYSFVKYAKLPVDIEIASEDRYLESPIAEHTLSIVISQSGETADTLALLRYAKANGQKVVGIINVPTSTMVREVDLHLQTLAGIEKSVASTKAFTCQMAVLACLAIAIGRARGVLSEGEEKELVAELRKVPDIMSEVLKLGEPIHQVARYLQHFNDVLYLGRGTCYPLALEGALKLKEVTYIHAEGYGAGELKHGPIAMLDHTRAVVVMAPREQPFFDKTVSNLREVASRDAPIVLISDEKGCKEASVENTQCIVLPTMHPIAVPFGYAVALQLLAYHTACEKGIDPDQPRNLAKSVTVE